MTKFKNTLVKKHKENEVFALEQERLKIKHNIDENKIIVEKNNTIKFLLKLSIAMVKTLIGIIIFVLTTVGILTLIYPTTRNDFLSTMNQIIGEIMNYI